MGAWLKRNRWVAPYALLAPGLAWLLFFYVIPAFQMFIASFWSGSVEQGYAFSFENWTNYPGALEQFGPFYVRSIAYAFAATLLTFLIAYPLAYAIAFRGGRQKNLLLFLVVAPFFTSFLLRTIAWKIILADSGLVLGPLKSIGLVPEEFRLLSTPIAVIFGITYTYLPFMTLPLYVAIEKVDIRLVEAARDLYAGPWRRQGAIVGGLVCGALGGVLGLIFGWLWPVMALLGAAVGAGIASAFVSEAFVRVTFPLSIPGVFAGSLLTFIPAIGDYVNAEILGNPDTKMIGNVIQNKFLTQTDYPTASALSFILMFGVLILAFVYARVLGTEEVTVGRV